MASLCCSNFTWRNSLYITDQFAYSWFAVLNVFLLEAETFNWEGWYDLTDISQNLNCLSYVFFKHHLFCVNNSSFYPKTGRNFNTIAVIKCCLCDGSHFLNEFISWGILNGICSSSCFLLLGHSVFQVFPEMDIAVNKAREHLK